jgi:hypothetical protein
MHHSDSPTTLYTVIHINIFLIPPFHTMKWVSGIAEGTGTKLISVFSSTESSIIQQMIVQINATLKGAGYCRWAKLIHKLEVNEE